MTPRTRTVLVVLAAAAALSLFAASCASDGPARTAGTTAATVGDTRISVDSLAQEIDRYTFLAGLNQASCGTPEDGESAEAACARFTLSNLIQDAFVRDFATANGIAVADADITSIIKDLDDGLGKQEVDRQLRENRLTREDLQALAERVLLFQAVRTSVAREQLTAEALRQLYRDQLPSYITIQVDHILVETQAQAEDAYRQVTAPGATEQDFLDLAKRISIDPSAKQNSGSLGSAVASTYVTEFAEAAVALEPGQISRPVQTQFGWHVIRMVDKQITTFAEAKEQLIADNAGTAFEGWLREQAQAAVDVSPRYGRWDAASVSVTRVSSTAAGESPTPSPSA